MKPFYFILFYFNTVIICFILQIEQLHTQSDISAYICIYVYIYVYKLFYMSLLHVVSVFLLSNLILMDITGNLQLEYI